MVAAPIAFAVTTPLNTVATESLEEVHTMPDAVPTGSIVAISPTVICKEAGLSEKEGALPMVHADIPISKNSKTATYILRIDIVFIEIIIRIFLIFNPLR